MMAWRADGAECVIGLPGHDLVDGVDGGTCRVQGGVPTTRRDDCVRVEPIVVALGNGGAHGLDISARVKALDNGKIGERGLLAREVAKTLLLESLVDGAQAIGALGMSEPRVMLKTGGMG